jgi:peptide/nickel transport system permease protein
MMRITDAFMAIPGLFLIIVIATMVKPTVPLMVVVLAGISWLGPSRLVRGEGLVLKTREYVQAAEVMGARQSRIIARHILPGTLATIVVAGTFQVADAVLTLAALGYLGLGVPPPSNDWGDMLSTGISYAYSGYWWLIVPPGVAIVLLVLALNFIGDGLRESLDSRLGRR